MSESPLTDVTVKTRPKAGEETSTRRIPPYNVILFNDNDHTMEFVIEVLSKALRYNMERCFQLMMEAHGKGRAIVWTGPKEGAELKAEQIQTFHETLQGGRALGPLGVTIEPAEG